MTTYTRAPDLGMPTPYHAQAAIEARALEARAAPSPEPAPVTEHVPPWRSYPVEALPTAARRFALAAEAAGCEVAARAAGVKAVQVGVKHRTEARLWQRATWRRDAKGAWKSVGVVSDGRALGVLAAKRAWAE